MVSPLATATATLTLATLTLATLSLAARAGAQDPTAPAGVAESSRVLAVKASRFLTMAGPIVDHGVMLVKGGKITELGTADEVDIPANAEILDLGTRIVCPGFVDLHHHVSSGGRDYNDMVFAVNPELRLMDAVRPTARAIKDTLAGGVTTTLFIPGSGTNISGFGVLLKMRWKARLEDMIVRELGAMKVAQGYNPERRAGDLGGTRMGMRDNLMTILRRGKAYADSWRAHRDNGAPKPALEPELEQLRRVFDREIPVLIHTAGARDCIATARMFQDVFDLWMILSHGTFDGHWAAAALAERKTPVNLGPRTYDFTRDGLFQGIAAGYWEQGCRDLSINTDAPVIPPDQLSLQAAMAVRLGLPAEAGLRGLTIVPARQIGLGDRVGSLEPGKDADFLVSAGDPLDPRFPPEQVFIEGRLVHRHGDVK